MTLVETCIIERCVWVIMVVRSRGVWRRWGATVQYDLPMSLSIGWRDACMQPFHFSTTRHRICCMMDGRTSPRDVLLELSVPSRVASSTDEHHIEKLAAMLQVFTRALHQLLESQRLRPHQLELPKRRHADQNHRDLRPQARRHAGDALGLPNR